MYGLLVTPRFLRISLDVRIKFLCQQISQPPADIWSYMDITTAPWDLSNDGNAGLDLIPDGKSLFPQNNANWKSLVPEKQNELSHVVVMTDESTAFTAEKDGDTSSSVASSTPTSPTSEVRKQECPPLPPGRAGLFPARRVPTPFFEWTGPRTF